MGVNGNRRDRPSQLQERISDALVCRFYSLYAARQMARLDSPTARQCCLSYDPPGRVCVSLVAVDFSSVCTTDVAGLSPHSLYRYECHKQSWILLGIRAKKSGKI